MLTVDLRALRLAPGSRVLDLACGTGRHIRGVCRALDGGAAVALDLGWAEVTATRDSLREAPDGGAAPWLVVQGDAYRLPFPAGAFDVVIASEILEHLPDDDRALGEIRRVLRAGGTLAVSVPRAGPEVVCWALSREYRQAAGGHVRIYRRRALARKLERHGFRVGGGHYAHGLHAPYWWLRCLVGLDKEQAWPVRWYHRLLVWDLFRKPRLTRWLERLLNPFIGKSVVLYATREPA